MKKSKNMSQSLLISMNMPALFIGLVVECKFKSNGTVSKAYLFFAHLSNPLSLVIDVNSSSVAYSNRISMKAAPSISIIWLSLSMFNQSPNKQDSSDALCSLLLTKACSVVHDGRFRISMLRRTLSTQSIADLFQNETDYSLWLFTNDSFLASQKRTKNKEILNRQIIES